MRLKILFILCVLMSTTATTEAQNQEWVDAATFGSANLHYMQPDGNGNYILVGEFGSQIENQTFKFPDVHLQSRDTGYIAILIVDSHFNILRYNYISSTWGLRPILSIDGKTYISFYTGAGAVVRTKNNTIVTQSVFANIITCFDEDLNLLWSKEAINSGDTRTTTLHYCGTLKGKAAVYGALDSDTQKPTMQIDSTVIQSPKTIGRGFLFLVDDSGRISDLTMFGKSSRARIDEFQKHNDDIYLISSSSARVILDEKLIYEHPTKSRYGTNKSLIKMDTALNVQWMQLIDLDGWGAISMVAMATDSNENVLVSAGYSTATSPPNERSDRLYVGDFFIEREGRWQSEWFNIALARLNAKGEVQWLKKLWSHGQQAAPSVICKSANHYLIFGRTSQMLLYDGDTLKHTYSDGSTAFLLEIDSNGTKLNFNMLGGNGSTFATKMLLEQNGDIVIAGNSYSGRVTFGDVKITVEDPTDQSTFYNWYIARKSSVYQKASEQLKNLNDVRIYPNPAHNKLYIDFLNDTSEKIIVLYNQLGQKVFSSRTTDKKLEITIEGLAVGIYFATLSTELGTTSRKVMIEAH